LQRAFDREVFFFSRAPKIAAAALWNLAAIITRTGMTHAQPQGINVFWKGHMDQAEQVSQWLRSEAVRKSWRAQSKPLPPSHLRKS